VTSEAFSVHIIFAYNHLHKFKCHSSMIVLCVSALLASSAMASVSVSLVPDNTLYAPGDTAYVSVVLNMNDVAAVTMTAISTDFLYDQSVFTFTGVTQGALLTHDWGDFADWGSQNPGTSLRIGGIDWDLGETFATGGTLFTFSLKVADTAPDGSYSLNWGEAGNTPAGFDYGDENWCDVIPPSDNTTLTVGNGAVPEPATIIVWSLLGVLGITGGMWRRKRTA
jgi:hypothetical protein